MWVIPITLTEDVYDFTAVALKRPFDAFCDNAEDRKKISSQNIFQSQRSLPMRR